MEWFRMYYEAQSDPKLEILSDAQHRVWFKLICYAAKSGGITPTKDHYLLAVEVAKGDVELFESTLNILKPLRIIEETDAGYSFINYQKRQYNKPSDLPDQVAARVRKYRETKKGNADVTPGNAPKTPETPPDTEADTNTDSDNDDNNHAREGEPGDNSEDEKKATLAAVSEKYENEIGLITPTIRAELTKMVDNYPRDWVIDAISNAARQNIRKLSYVSGTLENRKKGITQSRDKPHQPREPDDGLKSADEAWLEVVNAFGNRSPVWSNPIIGQAVKTLGGMGAIGQAAPGAMIKTFMSVYDGLRKRKAV